MTLGFGNQYSIQLSYGRVNFWSPWQATGRRSPLPPSRGKAWDGGCLFEARSIAFFASCFASLRKTIPPLARATHGKKSAIVRTMTFSNPSLEEICRILRSVRTIAVVGLSPNPARPSFRVAHAMQDYGYRIVPVRPLVQEVLGEPAYADLESLPFRVDMVNVFRAPQHVPVIVDSCIKLGITHLWLQDGVIHEEAAQRARAAGIMVVMNRCIWRDFKAPLTSAAEMARE